MPWCGCWRVDFWFPVRGIQSEKWLSSLAPKTIISVLSLFNCRKLWHIQSVPDSPQSVLKRMPFKTFTRAVSVLWWDCNSDWKKSRVLLEVRKTTFSIILLRYGPVMTNYWGIKVVLSQQRLNNCSFQGLGEIIWLKVTVICSKSDATQSKTFLKWFVCSLSGSR